jgi:hypothetical protein
MEIKLKTKAYLNQLEVNKLTKGEDLTPPPLVDLAVYQQINIPARNTDHLKISQEELKELEGNSGSVS